MISVYQGLSESCLLLDVDVHTVIIDKFIKAGKCHRAIRLFRRAIVENYPLDVVSYAVAICGLLMGGRIGEASTLYSQMKEISLSPNAHIYNVMLSSFCRERDIKMVKELLQEIIEARIELNYRTFMRENEATVRAQDKTNGNMGEEQYNILLYWALQKESRSKKRGRRGQGILEGSWPSKHSSVIFCSLNLFEYFESLILSVRMNKMKLTIGQKKKDDERLRKRLVGGWQGKKKTTT
ncbi:hypothetical protein Pint_07347 [Pistacia integerrima]|uniref:Uncharacterized protein n=1 Tax=Pistacia integerrima TaxID=434235 RepID=A0ACC0XWL6_9ROSI|nr:hypothetical protein Pint_07347 [Pistacia integerrima]